MSAPVSQNTQSDGQNLLKLLLKETTEENHQKQKLRIIQQLGQYPWAYKLDLNQYIRLQSASPYSYFNRNYHYSCYAPIPIQYFLQNKLQQQQDAFDFDEYLPQGELEWRRKTNDQTFDIEKKKREKAEK
uniref:Uncharacterized protein n=1 Tax=Caenorhabditis tropicalis TaxID=1561998 RepID=A0A1I7U405_9PELO